MTDTLCALLYSAFLVSNLVLFTSVLKRRDKSYFVLMYLLFTFALTGWQLCQIFFYLTDNARWASYLFDLKLVFVAYLAIIQLFLMMGFYRRQRAFHGWRLVALGIIPAITTVLALTTTLHPLLSTRLTFTALYPIKQYISQRGAWFYVHMVYSQVLVLLTFVLCFTQFRHIPRAYRNGPSIMFWSMGVYLAGAVAQLLFRNATPLDFNLIGVSLASLFVYLASFSARRPDYLYLEHGELFNYIHEAVFTLDAGGNVLEGNPIAIQWLQTFSLEYGTASFGSYMGKIRAMPNVRRRPGEDENSEYLYLLDSRHPLVFHLVRNAILDKKGKRLGEYVVIYDVTRDHLLIERLRQTVGVDPLTGLPNRYRYQELLRQLDSPRHYPLSIVIGDVNGLKEVNDTHGHQCGDDLLILIGGVLDECCPPDGFAARIGGDEFALLLPGHDRETAQEVMAQVQQRLAEVDAYPFVPSIALGCATKKSPNQNINSLIVQADRRMYSDKR